MRARRDEKRSSRKRRVSHIREGRRRRLKRGRKGEVRRMARKRVERPAPRPTASFVCAISS